jgi:cytochrome c556
LQIYQPRVLALPAGQPVQTAEGTYTPQFDEIWHSAAAYNALEQQLINAAAALAQQTK